jgi:formate hydrogenlyase transcriptional activator
LVATVIDVTERKRAEEELRRSEMECRQILDLAPQHIVVYGPNGERLYANRGPLDYLGLSLEEWRQFPGPGNYVHPDDTERLDGVFGRAVARASADELELRVRRNDGSYRWFLARFNPLRNEQGQISRWYIAGTDIEDRKQAEDRLRRENVALREEIDKASMFEEIVGTSPALKSQSGERGYFGAQLVHNKLQMRSLGATESALGHSKQMKRGEYEQGR